MPFQHLRPIKTSKQGQNRNYYIHKKIQGRKVGEKRRKPSGSFSETLLEFQEKHFILIFGIFYLADVCCKGPNQRHYNRKPHVSQLIVSLIQ